ncbi:hypothetical protein SAMN06265222_11246 [Neorhodopirellula lusitana]|uniref:Uncharacterized protein n=1 Tax=Neorhodopirellula lusitana TaxID=445327 RepID=A0ABY1QHF6_9BACT|nr:hypothetical protein [Neorhodopirellula lusitana]SMP69508.1 hypothetical protein SAMN06265222_11246 [Neorhodopirellula lusitana]
MQNRKMTYDFELSWYPIEVAQRKVKPSVFDVSAPHSICYQSIV